jgi:hypothetical protein
MVDSSFIQVYYLATKYYYIQYWTLTTPNSYDSILHTIASSAKSALIMISIRTSNSAGNLQVPTAMMNPATMNAVCASPPSKTHTIATTVAEIHGTDPATAMRRPLQPSTNSNACRRSCWRRRNTQSIHASLRAATLMLEGCLYAWNISRKVISSRGTTSD